MKFSMSGTAPTTTTIIVTTTTITGKTSLILSSNPLILLNFLLQVVSLLQNKIVVAHIDIQSNLPMKSPQLSNHLY
jgi:hypothetical protein